MTPAMSSAALTSGSQPSTAAAPALLVRPAAAKRGIAQATQANAPRPAGPRAAAARVCTGAAHDSRSDRSASSTNGSRQQSPPAHATRSRRLRPALLHGTGAETPTQVVLFASGAPGNSVGAAVILLAFLAGLILSDIGVTVAWLAVLIGTRRLSAVQIGLGPITGLPSVAAGVLIIDGHAAVLPALFGG